jgi:acyl-CoA oxidase
MARRTVSSHGKAPPATPPAISFEARTLQQLLDGDQRDIREAVRAELRHPRFAYRYGLATDAYRALVFDWLRELARKGFGAMAYPVGYGGGGDIARFLAIFETLGTHDQSLVVKFGVQFGLFGGSIYQLGTERHHARYLRDIGSLELPGCFAMSELGHGSNVREIETEASYDPAAREFVIHTPRESARKEWIGNAACHGRVATVFAQLSVGGDRHGVHAFIVPIRAPDGSTLPGVRIEDIGEKAGLNGVDNGRLWFDRVRIPRENLLNRYGDVSAEGVYASPIASSSRRFFTMLGTLVAGRMSVALAAVSAAKVGLTIAVRYAATRRQFGPSEGREVLILDYLTHQRRLFPAIATTYALDFALKRLVARFLAAEASHPPSPAATTRHQQVESDAAGLKALATWHTIAALQAARECCGGQGFLAVNRIAQLRADTDITATFEGDNTVLLQLVAKGLLTDYHQQFNALGARGILRYLGRRASARLGQVSPLLARRADDEHLRGEDFQLGMLRYREERLLASAARRLKHRLDGGADSFSAMVECQDHLLLLARAHVERLMLEEMVSTVRAADSGLQPVLGRLRELFALSVLEHDDGWFLAHGVLDGSNAKALRTLVGQICRELRPQAVPLVDAFGIPDEILGAPIAGAPDSKSRGVARH